jgi:hypothetical protein
MTSIQSGNASAPTEPVTALLLGKIRPESETRNYKGAEFLVSSAGKGQLPKPFGEVDDPYRHAPDNRGKSEHGAYYNEFEFSIALFVRGRQ